MPYKLLPEFLRKNLIAITDKNLSVIPDKIEFIRLAGLDV